MAVITNERARRVRRLVDCARQRLAPRRFQRGFGDQSLRKRICIPTQCICAGVTVQNRAVRAVNIICGTRSPQISACVCVGIRKFCSASASA